MILFESWVPTSSGAYLASCLAVIALGVALQASLLHSPELACPAPILPLMPTCMG